MCLEFYFSLEGELRSGTETKLALTKRCTTFHKKLLKMLFHVISPKSEKMEF